MREMTIVRLCELDVLFSTSPKARNFIRQALMETILHDDNMRIRMELSEELHLEICEMSSYIWLQIYIKDLAFTCREIPRQELVAQQFNRSPFEFDDYVRRRVLAIKRELELADAGLVR